MELQPENNMLLLFPSRLLHEVVPVVSPPRQFVVREVYAQWLGQRPWEVNIYERSSGC